jgi:alkanesulfonate monooxygenase SsuD/methylene tetrahydromethanopterin reductase-like flavin-dependent oxidoreductase (luciferase family)
MEDGIRVERLGFDAVWIADHYYLAEPSGINAFPEAWTLLTAIAVRTERLIIGTNVLSASFRHPSLLAKMALAIQELSAGRFVLGLGAGNQVHEHAAFGLDFDHRIGRLKEYLPILAGLLRGETVTFTGQYYTLSEASLRTPVQPLPVWLGADGPRMLDLTARYASGWNIGRFGTDLGAIKAKLDAFSMACNEVNRKMEDFDMGKMTFIAVAPNAAGAMAMVDELSTKRQITPETLKAQIVVATPDGIAAHLHALMDLGVSHHILVVLESEQWPNHSDAVEFVASDVLPRVRVQS